MTGAVTFVRPPLQQELLFENIQNLTSKRLPGAAKRATKHSQKTLC